MNHNDAQYDETLIDIGANLTHSLFSTDIKQTLERAQLAGVEHVIVTGTNIDESQKAVTLATQYPDMLSATVGIHPHDAKHFDNNSLIALRELAQHPQVVALGETGLDFFRNFSTSAKQVNAFEKQLELAAELGLPVFLHEREAFKAQWEILKTYRHALSNAVIHCFTGSREQAYHYLDLDLYIGITAWICDNKRGRHLQELVGDIPLNRIMIESDAPYLIPKTSPKPKLVSKRRNEPCTLPIIIETIAQHSKHSQHNIALASTQNARHFFALKKKNTTDK